MVEVLLGQEACLADINALSASVVTASPTKRRLLLSVAPPASIRRLSLHVSGTRAMRLGLSSTARRVRRPLLLAPLPIRDQEGEAALHQAAFAGHLEVLKFLLAKGADVNTANKACVPAAMPFASCEALAAAAEASVFGQWRALWVYPGAW